MHIDLYLRSVLQFELSARVGQMVMEKGTSMDLQQLEDSESYDTLQRPMREVASSSSGSGRRWRSAAPSCGTRRS